MKAYQPNGWFLLWLSKESCLLTTLHDYVPHSFILVWTCLDLSVLVNWSPTTTLPLPNTSLPEVLLLSSNLNSILLRFHCAHPNLHIICKVWVAKVRARTHTCDVRSHVCVRKDFWNMCAKCVRAIIFELVTHHTRATTHFGHFSSKN